MLHYKTEDGKIRDITAIHYVGKDKVVTDLVALYDIFHELWSAVYSCYGSGAWLSEKPWTDTDGWKDN